MSISGVSGLGGGFGGAANVRGKDRENDGDKDDKGGVQASGNAAGEQQVKSAQNTSSVQPTTSTDKSDQQSNTVQTNQGPKQGGVNTVA